MEVRAKKGVAKIHTHYVYHIHFNAIPMLLMLQKQLALCQLTRPFSRTIIGKGSGYTRLGCWWVVVAQC